MADVKTTDPPGADPVDIIALLKVKYGQRAASLTDGDSDEDEDDDNAGGGVSLREFPDAGAAAGFAEDIPKTDGIHESVAIRNGRGLSRPSDQTNATEGVEAVGSMSRSNVFPGVHRPTTNGPQGGLQVAIANGVCRSSNDISNSFVTGVCGDVTTAATHDLRDNVANRGIDATQQNTQQSTCLNPATKPWVPNENFVRMAEKLEMAANGQSLAGPSSKVNEAVSQFTYHGVNDQLRVANQPRQQHHHAGPAVSGSGFPEGTSNVPSGINILGDKDTSSRPQGGVVDGTIPLRPQGVGGIQGYYKPVASNAMTNGMGNGALPLSKTFPQLGQIPNSSSPSSVADSQYSPLPRRLANGNHNQSPAVSYGCGGVSSVWSPSSSSSVGMVNIDHMPLSAAATMAQSLADPFVAGTMTQAGPLVGGNPYPIGPLALYPPPASNHGPVPPQIRVKRSFLLNELTSGPSGRPTLEQALHPANFPFHEGARQCGPANFGVVKIKNIPFSTRRAELIAFFGRNSKILNDCEEGVHIIMERVTSKTEDAYVEFMTGHDAAKAVEKIHLAVSEGRIPRLGERPVDVELSSQSALMADLFPVCRGVEWTGAYPTLAPRNDKQPWNNFKGFFSEEEMTMLVKHVEVPNRSPFSRDCLQRPYECLISTLKKMPWYKTELITVRQRYSVFRACLELVRLLQKSIRDRRHNDLNGMLLKRLVTAGMLCPGFTVLMKDSIAYQAGLTDMDIRSFNQPRFANMWVHQYALAPKPDTPLDMLEWYIAIIREETTRQVHALPLNDRAQVQSVAADTNLYWGYFWIETGVPFDRSFDDLTLAAVHILECEAIQNIFARAFAS